MKYIDADKLKFLINEIYPDAQDSRTCGAMDALDKVYDFIYSLQQEQPELPKIAEYYYHKGLYEGLSQGRTDALKILEESMKRKADPVIVIKQQEQQDFPTTDEQMKEFLATHPKIQVPEKYKNPDWLFKKQEQQEEDFEKEINKWLDGPTTDLRTMARHFAEWQKEQMLKDAKDGYVSAIIIHNDGDEEHYAVTYPNGERPHSITDKVKIIIL